MVFDVIHFRIKRQIQSWFLASQFFTSTVVVPLFDAVERLVLKVEMKFVGKEFPASRQKRKITKTKNTNSSNPHAVAGRTSPILKPSKKYIFFVVCLRFTCSYNVKTLLIIMMHLKYRSYMTNQFSTQLSDCPSLISFKMNINKYCWLALLIK